MSGGDSFAGTSEVVRRTVQKIELLDPPEDAPALTAQVEAYRDWLVGQGFSNATIDARVTLAKRLLFEWGSWDQPPSTVAVWIGQYSQWTRRTYQAHLTTLYAFLLETGAVEASPIAQLRRAPTPRPRPKPLTDAELATVLAAATGDLRAWLLLASKAGLRAHEVAKVRGEDFDRFGLTVAGKGGKVERLPVHPTIRGLAEEYPRIGWWFPQRLDPSQHVLAHSVSTKVSQHFAGNGVEGGIHRCRHTYGTHLVRAGTPIHVVRDLMRHASLDTTQLYLGVDENERLAAIGRI